MTLFREKAICHLHSEIPRSNGWDEVLMVSFYSVCTAMTFNQFHSVLIRHHSHPITFTFLFLRYKFTPVAAAVALLSADNVSMAEAAAAAAAAAVVAVSLLVIAAAGAAAESPEAAVDICRQRWRSLFRGF